MKKLIISSSLVFVLFALLTCPSPAQQGTKTAFNQITITNLHTVDTNWVSGTNILTMKVTVMGLKAGGVSNAANVFVGPVTGTTAYVIAPGTVHTIETQPGTCFNMKEWWLRTPTTGDGIIIIYQ
jgi:hypothetical protein